jgi:hypothetical protein
VGNCGNCGQCRITQFRFSYVDTPLAAALSATRTLWGSTVLAEVARYGGMGRKTKAVSGTSDSIAADTVYGALNRVYQFSNPYRTSGGRRLGPPRSMMSKTRRARPVGLNYGNPISRIRRNPLTR